MSNVTIERPWDYRVQGRVELTEADLEALTDRLVPSRVGLTYDSVEHQLILTGYTTSMEPWAAIGWILSTVASVLGVGRLQMVQASVSEGDTDAEVEAWLREIGLIDDGEAPR